MTKKIGGRIGKRQQAFLAAMACSNAQVWRRGAMFVCHEARLGGVMAKLPQRSVGGLVKRGKVRVTGDGLRLVTA